MGFRPEMAVPDVVRDERLFMGKSPGFDPRFLALNLDGYEIRPLLIRSDPSLQRGGFSHHHLDFDVLIHQQMGIPPDGSPDGCRQPKSQAVAPTADHLLC